MIKDRYPLPLIQDKFDELEGSNVFSTLDMCSGYWQIPVDETSIKKTAVVYFTDVCLSGLDSHLESLMRHVSVKEP